MVPLEFIFEVKHPLNRMLQPTPDREFPSLPLRSVALMRG